MASLFLPANILIKLDLPTLERPIKAYSGNLVGGHWSTRALLITNSALLISILSVFLSTNIHFLSDFGYLCTKFSVFKSICK